MSKIDGYVLETYWPSQLNSPHSFVTVYVPLEPVRSWPSFRRREDDEVAEPAADWPILTKEGLGGGIEKSSENASTYQTVKCSLGLTRSCLSAQR